MVDDWRWKLANELRNTQKKSAKRIAEIVMENTGSIILTRLPFDFDKNLRAGNVVILDIYCIRHLYNAGYITGLDKTGKKIKMPLSADDLSEVKMVVDAPDTIEIVNSNVRNNNARYKLERQVSSRHRVIIEVMERKRLRIVTVYNIKNKPSP